jgi:hypothetical protein
LHCRFSKTSNRDQSTGGLTVPLFPLLLLLVLCCVVLEDEEEGLGEAGEEEEEVCGSLGEGGVCECSFSSFEEVLVLLLFFVEVLFPLLLLPLREGEGEEATTGESFAIEYLLVLAPSCVVVVVVVAVGSGVEEEEEVLTFKRFFRALFRESSRSAFATQALQLPQRLSLSPSDN